MYIPAFSERNEIFPSTSGTATLKGIGTAPLVHLFV